MAKDIFRELPEDFFDSSLSSLNPLTRHYHGSRIRKIRDFIAPRFRQGMLVLDIGCGSANWNANALPVTGVDTNEAMLRFAKEKKRISDYVVCDISRQLPFPDNRFDFVIASEVLEHMQNPGAVVAEAARVLRIGGFLAVTVPLDSQLSAWRVLFGMECFVFGDILGSGFYRERCGHVQQFSAPALQSLLERAGFEIVEKDVSIMNVGMLAKKA